MNRFGTFGGGPSGDILKIDNSLFIFDNYGASIPLQGGMCMNIFLALGSFLLGLAAIDDTIGA